MRLRPLLSTLCALACRRAPPTPGNASQTPLDTGVVRADVTAPHGLRDVLTRDAAPPGAPSPSLTTPAMVDPNATSVDRLIAVADGAVLLRALNRDRRRASEIVATRVDIDGNPVGAPRLLRRTTGPVTALEGDAAAGALWVAWGSMRPAGEGRVDVLVAAMRVTADLATTSAPLTLHDFRAMDGGEGDPAPQALSRVALGVIARDDGGAVVVSSSPETRCLHGDDDHVERVPCRGWTVARISPGGAVQTTTEGAIAHSAGPASLTALPGGFAYAVSSEHIGSKTDVHVSPLERAANPPFGGDTCWHYADVHLARHGASLLALGRPTEEGMAPSPYGHARVFGPAAGLTRTRQDAHGGEEWPAVRSLALRCEAGRPVIAVRWAGGGATLDPARDGHALRWSEWVRRSELPGLEGDGPTPQLAYTGRALVAWDAGGWNRYRCGARGSIAPMR